MVRRWWQVSWQCGIFNLATARAVLLVVTFLFQGYIINISYICRQFILYIWYTMQEWNVNSCISNSENLISLKNCWKSLHVDLNKSVQQQIGLIEEPATLNSLKSYKNVTGVERVTKDLLEYKELRGVLFLFFQVLRLQRLLFIDFYSYKSKIELVNTRKCSEEDEIKCRCFSSHKNVICC